jgi:hypothetical protein
MEAVIQIASFKVALFLRTTDFPVRRFSSVRRTSQSVALPSYDGLPVRRSSVVRRTSQSVAFPSYDGLPSPSLFRRTTDFQSVAFPSYDGLPSPSPLTQVPRLKPGATCFRRSAARRIRKRHSVRANRLESRRRTRKSVVRSNRATSQPALRVVIAGPRLRFGL